MQMKLQNGYDDGSGKDKTLVNSATGEPVAVLRWGCGCCERSGPPTEEEKALAAQFVQRWNAFALPASCVWGLVNPRGKLMRYSIRSTRRASIYTLVMSAENWKRMYRKGWRCVRVTVHAVLDIAQE